MKINDQVYTAKLKFYAEKDLEEIPFMDKERAQKRLYELKLRWRRMTEKQLITMYERDTKITIEKFGENQEQVRINNLIIGFLKEHMQYRSIGTVEEFQKAMKKEIGDEAIYMENVDKTIDSICNWIQKELKDDSSIKASILPKMTNALASLVRARNDEGNCNANFNLKEKHEKEGEWVFICIEATKQNTCARMKIEYKNYFTLNGNAHEFETEEVAVLYDVCNLKPFQGCSKDRILDKEEDFYMGSRKTLIQANSSPLGFWLKDSGNNGRQGDVK